MSVILHSAFKPCVTFGYYSQTLFKSAQSRRFKTVKRKGSIKRTYLIQYLSIYLPPVLFFSMRTQRAVLPVCCDSVLFQEHHSAHGMCIAPCCIEPFVLQYFSAMKYNILSCSVLSIICCWLITVLYIYKYIFKFYSIYLYVFYM